jgi:3-oxoacyl-[acyl-carrier-protein] synthase-1
VVSSIGTDAEAVLESLWEGRSGIVRHEEYVELGFRTAVHGSIDLDFSERIDRKQLRFMGGAAACGHVALSEAVAHAQLPEDQISNERTGLIFGSGGPSTEHVVEMADILRQRGLRRVGPYMVPRTMASSTSACLATAFKIKGVSYTISSACATSSHCIGNAMELIQAGRQDVMLAGGGEAVHWTQTLPFDAMGALSTKYNDTPARASRPYDKDRDGFVVSGGGGALVLEALEHAQARGATIYAELLGYGATSDGYDMVQPEGKGAVRCMQQALSTVDAPIDYLNTHGTSTPIGDVREVEAVRAVFGDNMPPLSSTKSLTGHALGAAGVHEAVYSLLMMSRNFISASANVENLDPDASDIPVVTERRENAELNTVMSNSFGFGGTNACLVLGRWTGE